MINNKFSFFHDYSKDIIIPDECKFIFINDFFSDDLLGGAEITSDSLISYLDNNSSVFKIKSQFVNENFISENLDKIFIIGNFSNLSVQSINKLINFAKYVNIEYDYKFCKHRSLEKHKFLEKKIAIAIHKILEILYLHSIQIHNMFFGCQKNKKIFFIKDFNL